MDNIDTIVPDDVTIGDDDTIGARDETGAVTPRWPTRTTDGLISAVMSAIASESASPARAGATGV